MSDAINKDADRIRCELSSAVAAMERNYRDLVDARNVVDRLEGELRRAEAAQVFDDDSGGVR